MTAKSTQQQVSCLHTTRLFIGLVAISLPFLANFLSGEPRIPSISASYYAGDWPRNIFVGFLIAISALFLVYHGRNRHEYHLSNIAAVAAFTIATFPEHQRHLEWVHSLASVVMFVTLALFCYQFYKSARSKTYPEAKIRAFIYAACGIIIIASIALVALRSPLKDSFLSEIDRLIFYCETAGLLAFGIAWLVASRIIPVITHHQERMELAVRHT